MPHVEIGEVLSLGGLLLASLFVLAKSGEARPRRVAMGAVLVIVMGASAALAGRGAKTPEPAPSVPRQSASIAYAGSAACLGCHPGEHASFSRTYHRTMTQVATTKTVLAPLDGRPLALEDGRVVRFAARANGEVWASLPNPDPLGDEDAKIDVEERVVMTTGSHREQAYWVKGRRRGDLRLVPFVWMVRDRAFVARRDAFILPPHEPMPKVRWASSCIACHAVAGQPGHDPTKDEFDTRVAELGIACEACHGPGAAHAERLRDPAARYVAAATKARTDIVHPGKIDPERSAAVCGQCHAYAFPRDEDAWWTDGYAKTFRPGDALEPSRTLLSNALLDPTQPKDVRAPRIDAPASSIFWPSDGAVRVGGREYNGLVESPCYLRGRGDRKMTCLSCHAMHRGDPEGQLAPDRAGDAACTTCHTDERARTHGHHAHGSPGNACVSCHMTKTSFALLSAVRSHRIESPKPRTPGSKPNACNLCHLDRSNAWASRFLSTWYGLARPSGSDDDTVPVGLHDGIAGDAGMRALIADALGGSDAQRAIGGSAANAGPSEAFQRRVLRAMRDHEPYPAVRFIVDRSLRAVSSAGFVDAGQEAAFPADLVTALVDSRDNRPLLIAE